MSECGEQHKIVGLACAFSSVYLSVWLAWWVWQLVKRRNFHVFNWVVLFLLTINIVESAVASTYFFTGSKSTIKFSYFVLDAVKLAGNTAYLFPIVRGNVTFEEKQPDKSEWVLLLCAMAVYSPVLLCVRFTQYFAQSCTAHRESCGAPNC